MMFLDPVDNDKKHQKKGIETAGFDVGVLIREVITHNQKNIEMIIFMNAPNLTFQLLTHWHFVTRHMLAVWVS
jgi:hypothetical protein